MAAETETALALVSIEEGHAADAEAAVGNSSQNFIRKDRPMTNWQPASCSSRPCSLIRSRLMHSMNMKQAQNLAKKSQNPYVRLQYAIAGARVKLNSDHPAESRPLLVQIDEEARRRDFKGIELEDRLLQAELAEKDGALCSGTRATDCGRE